MIELVPLEIYSAVYYNLVLAVVLLVFIQSRFTNIDSSDNLKSKRIIGFLFLAFLIFYMGVRPVSGIYFGDMARYSRQFIGFSEGQPLILDEDILFSMISYGLAQIVPVTIFFVLLSFVYFYAAYKSSRYFFDSYWLYGFLMQIAGISFWGAGTNGLRNGLAVSIFLLALTYKKFWVRLLVLALSVLCHSSMILPVLAYVVTMFYKKTKTLIYLWLLAIPMSAVSGGLFEGIFSHLGFGLEERLEGYFTELDEGIATSKAGFRLDFLLYSATGVLTAWYFILKKKYEDPIYTHLCNTFIITNMFWIMVINANFSNRFAYLSWFLLGLVIIYPFLKLKFFNNQHVLVGRILLVYFMVNYLINFML